MHTTHSAPILPPSVLQSLARALLADLMTVEGRPAVDFSKPAGEPALVPPQSVSWRVFKNPVALFVGGVAAVILELAEPHVRAGVWQFTGFRTDPVTRLRRTGLAAMITVYGARRDAEAMIAGVRRMHDKVAGVTETGAPYHANDPELLNWVQATAAFGFLQAYHHYVRPLSRSKRDLYYGEGKEAAALYGASGAPQSEAELEALFRAMTPRLERSPVILEFLDIMRRAPVFPAPLRPMQRLLVRAAVELTPPAIRRKLGLAHDGLRVGERALVQLAGRLSDRVVIDASPAVQACRRLRLPKDYLYRDA
jgi:uncharacterized protein (DUF2236 family)